VTNIEDAVAAFEAGADALGFNFAEEAKKRNRYIDLEEARVIMDTLPPFVTKVAVTVDESYDLLIGFMGAFDFVQLSGDEPAEVADDVQDTLGPVVIKTFRTGADFTLDEMLAYPAAAYLLDASVPGSHGGTGVTCDWETAKQAVATGRPIILAGGLTPDNVAEAVRTVRPYAVDVAGGVESEPGKKDHDKLRAFIRNAKCALLG
jgi:phosphoribosylanthranilate isomerase